MKIRNISLRVILILVLTVVFVVATIGFTIFDIRIQTENMEDSLTEEARTFAREMDAVWQFMDNSQYTINNTTDGTYEFKGLHCAIVGKSVGAIFSAGNNYAIRYTNSEPRRAQDKPDAFESEALALFNESSEVRELSRIVGNDPEDVNRARTSADTGAAQFRYVQALSVNESCLECHGEPVGEIDITGFEKEGWTLDSIGGAISIVIPLEQQYQALRDNVIRDVSFFLLLATFIGVVVFGLMTVFVLRPLESMKRAFGEVGAGRLSQSMDNAGTAREVASLIDRFNAMAQELRVTYEGLEDQVTERTLDLRRANEELAAQRDSLEVLSAQLAKESQVKTDLLSMVNHELRTPLTSIITLAQIALDSGNADVEERKSWEEVRKSSSVLLGMINNMLDIARSDAGSMAVSSEIMDLGDIIATAQGTLGPLAINARVTLKTSVAPDVPLVYGDFEKMQRILENLGTNAVKFTASGGVVALSVSVEAETEDVLVQVSDNGIGIAEEDQERIFERFFQVDSSTTRIYGGSGLGLALVREYAVAQGFGISVESELGEGSTFTVRIPKADTVDFSEEDE
ncbi:DUF3365 domain-containing protein [Adlercreutzia sp. R25]|uniref:histidine kinase n=1 Tax=Adlercreutzia shanghongiae TaxID=3111773 RepID=A0ABU6IZQ1_9ACTN|nr:MULTISPECIES: DUF3365 domain-containing protein [unclassified Adlercreutzia]MEC4273155.1 DUF3365 domain-containing protein [Adlercreutzia sp. R25]MEC4295361.1 DUF3365 domain-containing protein [Adlercreutzia sp. R22]